MSVLTALPLPHTDDDLCGDAPTVRLAAAFHEMDRAHRRLYRQISKDLGFSQIELTALMAVGDSLLLTPKALSEETGLTTGAITAMVDRLMNAGYVFRKPNVRDRRSIIIYLTDRGKETLDVVRDRYERALLTVLDEAPCLAGVHTSQCLRSAAHILLTA
ncbi:MarR family transcriptional regulator [Frondihabitans sp. 4ASC-45]|uniref:MarR family winged helix-turn-helix transcriptional regulator n=1 Tax=Frondihabitans sp. 4ASC-45 TaxID=3111636 RepID=UPI003C1C66FC